MISKEKELKKIAVNIASCRLCQQGMSGLPVPGEGAVNAKLMFIGEAPGVEESKTGRPFIGRSGKLLTQILAEIGLKREEVFITSPVKYFPGRRAPTSQEIDHGRTHLLAQIKVIQPKFIVLMGTTAVKALLPDETFHAVKDHGRVVTQSGQTYFLTFHPAAALRSPKIWGGLMRADFKKLLKLL
ncbi:MAG: uracil-DNA glycosylase [candidate division WWE3 bacterium]|nr:uracil-DNA glycosylase [candidate division WWE3 bacterium]